MKIGAPLHAIQTVISQGWAATSCIMSVLMRCRSMHWFVAIFPAPDPAALPGRRDPVVAADHPVHLAAVALPAHRAPAVAADLQAAAAVPAAHQDRVRALRGNCTQTCVWVWSGNFGQTDLNYWIIGQDDCHLGTLGCECGLQTRPTFPGVFPLQSVVVTCSPLSQGVLE